MSRATALLLTVATGTSGLVYEVTWERMLAILLGSHAEAAAAVLAFFLGGLALGYAAFGEVSRRLAAPDDGSAPRRLLLGYGIAEASIGLYALAFEHLFAVARWLSPHGPAQPALAFAFDAALAAALVLPGAALMGATIPMLTQALSRAVADATRIHAAVYGANTLGAFAGALAGAWWLVPALGLVGTLRAMACINLAAASGFALLAWRGGFASTASPAASTSRPPLRLGAYALAACLLGAAMMTLQTALIRVGNLALGASLFTFANVVAVFVLCIALGSLAVGVFERVPRAALPICVWSLFALLTALYFPLDDAPYYVHRLRVLFRDRPQGLLPFHFAVLLALLLAIGPALALSGAALPLIFDRLRREHGELGDAAGRLYGWNTLGSLLGALLGGYALLHWLDLHHVYRLALVAIAIAAALLTPAARGFAAGPQPALLCALALLLPALLPAWSPERLSTGAFRSRRPLPTSDAGPAVFAAQRWAGSSILFADDDPTASIVVSETRKRDGQTDRQLITNGKTDGSARADFLTMAMTALLPAWLAPRVERAFVIGYGTGVTASELALLDETREVIVAEISPAVAAAAPLFDEFNQGASRNPEIHVVRGDAYRVLLRSAGRFDVIASEPSNPWVQGVEMLYSIEFLRAAKQHLAPGGVYCQWMHSYESDADTVALVLRTYASVFEHVAVWYGLDNDLLLLGFEDPTAALDARRLSERAMRPDFSAGFARSGLSDFGALLAHELWPVGVLHALALQGPLHTLLHPRLSQMAARAFFVGSTAELPSSAAAQAAEAGRRNALASRYAAQGGMSADERLGFVSETCRYRARECVTLLAQWRAEQPDAPEIAKIEQWIRAEPRLARRINLDRERRLAPFFGGPLETQDGSDRAELALEQADLFVRYYHHAAPFRRAALRQAFAACEAVPESAEACRAGRQSVEQALGPLEGDG